MAGKCGTVYRVDSPLNPSACNALTRTGTGLLVPSTVLEGVASGVPFGAGRSVDVDVTAPDDGTCPETWQVGARLNPPVDMVTGAVDLQPTASGTWTPVTGATVTLPEPGRYEMSADVRARISNTGPSNVFIVARLFDVTTNAPIADSETLVLQVIQGAGGTDATGNQTASLGVFVDVSTATATVRLEAQRTNSTGNPSTVADIQNSGVGATRLRYRKVAD